MLWRMRRLAAILAVLAASAAHAQFRERIEVVRIVIDVRVTDYSGNAITDLKPADFDIRIGGKRAEIEAVEWINDSGAAAASAAEDEPGGRERPPLHSGRLFVLFIQTDFARNSFRVGGQMSFMRYAEELIESLAPEDRVAVLQFDSHLKLRLDFTSDKGDVINELRNALRIDRPPEPPIVHEPSLASRLVREDMRKAPDSETGILVVANALRSIPGPKTMLLLGWGL